MKKTLFILALWALLFVPVFSEGTDSSEILIYNEINSYFQTEYYPGVVEKAAFLEENYSESVFINPAMILKAEALLKMGQYSSAKETCMKIIPTMHMGSENFGKAYFFLGKACYYQQEYAEALTAFHKSCSISKQEADFLIYNPSVLFAGRSLFIIKNYKEATALFEYIIGNGKEYSLEDYNEALQKLFICYAETSQFQKTIALYEQLDETKIAPKVFTIISMYAADAYDKTGAAEKSYKLYSKLIENEDTNIGITALKKAYVISSQNNINVEPAQVLEKIQKGNLNPENTLSEFWTRLGIDAYWEKNYTKARECFGYAKEHNSSALKLVTQIYENRMLLDEADSSAKKLVAEEVENNLTAIEAQIWDSSVTNISDSFYSVLIYAKACKNDWKSIPQLYEKLSKPDSQTYYLTAAALYKYLRYEKAEEIILQDLSTIENLKLYASILSKQKKYSEADKCYQKLKNKNAFTESDYIEHAKVLCQLKKWTEAKKEAEASTNKIKYYILGIADFSLGNYTQAKEAFEQYISKAEAGDSDKANSVFYSAYTSYKTGDYKQSYDGFDLYINKYAHNQKLELKAYELAAKSAIMTGDYKKAAVQGETLVKKSAVGSEKYNAAVFCSQIYVDSGDFDKAVSVLSDFANGKSEFVIPALFQTAVVYEKAGNIDEADLVFGRIAQNYSGTPEAEEAMYRRGEIYYSVKNYTMAEERFTKYLYNYVNGKFTDAAYYFSGECNLNVENYNRSIMQNTTLLEKYENSIYAYGAGKNLLQAYYAVERYSEALNIAKKINRNYREQAEFDGISTKIKELEMIVAGTDRKIVEKLTEYEKAGKSSTKKGRIIGNQLVQLYGTTDSSEDSDRALSLAFELMEKQVAPDELIYAAENAEYIAKYYRNLEKNQKAAEMYLKAAEYYRTNAAESVKAASALYSAAEAFVAAELKADAKATADLLIQLYPDSKQAERVSSIVR